MTFISDICLRSRSILVKRRVSASVAALALGVGLVVRAVASTAVGGVATQSTDSPVHVQTDAARLRRSVTIDNWDDGGDASHFAYLHISEIFPAALVPRQGPVAALEEAPSPAVGAHIVEDLIARQGPKETLDQYVAGNHGIDGFIVLHRGRIVYEAYPRMRREDKHLLMSVTKAIVGTAVGLLEDQGRIDVRREVGHYIAGLKGTAWEHISIRDVLEMSSGMEGVEGSIDAYSNPTHKHYQYEASLGWQPTTPEMPESVVRADTYRYLASLKRLGPPGETWAYTSVNTAILGWLLEAVTGKPLADVIADQIWSKIGAEGDAMLVVNKTGIAVAHGGFAATLRDLARFGLLFTPSRRAASENPVISKTFFERITRNGRRDLVKNWIFGPRPSWLDHVAYQWDGVTTTGWFFKGGFGGQILYVAPDKDVVVAHFGTNKSLNDPGPVLNIGALINGLF